MARIEDFHNRKVILPQIFKPSQGELDNCNRRQGQEERTTKFLNILRHFSTPKQVLQGRTKDLRLEIIEHQLTRKDNALFVELRILAESMMIKYK